MGNFYKLVGTQDQQGEGIASVLVESATEEHPEKVLVLNGEPKELEQWQVDRLARYVKLELVEDYQTGEVPALVEQPGLATTSTSTDVPPREPAPDFDNLSYDDLRKLASQEDIAGRSGLNQDELRELVRTHYATQEG